MVECSNPETAIYNYDVKKVPIIQIKQYGQVFCFDYNDVDYIIQYNKNPFNGKAFDNETMNQLNQWFETQEEPIDEQEEEIPEIQLLKNELIEKISRINPYVGNLIPELFVLP